MFYWKNSFLISIVLFSISLGLLHFIGNILGWDQNLAIIHDEYCESTNFTSWVRQPVNTLSNYAYFLFGVLILLQTYTVKQGVLSKHRLLGYFAGMTSILVGFSSLFFHGAYVTWAKTLDSSFTFAGALAILLIILRARMMTSQIEKIHWYDLILTIISVGVIGVFIALDMDAIYFVLAIVAVSLILVIWETHQGIRFEFKYFVLGILTLIISFLIRYIDTQKTICNPHSLIQLHAVWHLGSALAYWWLFRFLQSARLPPKRL